MLNYDNLLTSLINKTDKFSTNWSWVYPAYFNLSLVFSSGLYFLLYFPKEDKTLEEVQAAKPTKEFDEKWGNGFLNPDQFTAIVYSDLKRFEK